MKKASLTALCLLMCLFLLPACSNKDEGKNNQTDQNIQNEDKNNMGGDLEDDIKDGADDIKDGVEDAAMSARELWTRLTDGMTLTHPDMTERDEAALKELYGIQPQEVDSFALVSSDDENDYAEVLIARPKDGYEDQVKTAAENRKKALEEKYGESDTKAEVKTRGGYVLMSFHPENENLLKGFEDTVTDK